MNKRTYSELISLETLKGRFEYLSLSQSVGATTFGFNRYVNQSFYNSKEWKDVRNFVIIRDGGCDLALPGRTIFSGVRVHHMNPMTVDDMNDDLGELLDPEFLVCTSLETHNALHFGKFENIFTKFEDRKRGDTTPWIVS